MDRFSQGLRDPQEDKVLGYCNECGDELYDQDEADEGLCDDCQREREYDEDCLDCGCCSCCGCTCDEDDDEEEEY